MHQRHSLLTPSPSFPPPLAVRMRQHVTARLSAHSEEVCGLKWSPSGRQLASGGNDNLLYIWDAAALPTSSTAQSPRPSTHSLSFSAAQPWLHRLEAHTAAVKALAWCPFQANLLASGGGTMDRCIRFWNTHTGSCINSVDTGSQVSCTAA